MPANADNIIKVVFQREKYSIYILFPITSSQKSFRLGDIVIYSKHRIGWCIEYNFLFAPYTYPKTGTNFSAVRSIFFIYFLAAGARFLPVLLTAAVFAGAFLAAPGASPFTRTSATRLRMARILVSLAISTSNS